MHTGVAAAPAIVQQPQVTGPTEISDAATASYPGQPGASPLPRLQKLAYVVLQCLPVTNGGLHEVV